MDSRATKAGDGEELMKLNLVPLRYRPRPTDVVVATFPKNGTTWVLHICHQLRMRGAEPDFADQEDMLSLLDLIPLGLSAGKVLGADGVDRSIQSAEPHIFATHVRCDAVPRGGKIITCVREPKMSFFRCASLLIPPSLSKEGLAFIFSAAVKFVQ